MKKCPKCGTEYMDYMEECLYCHCVCVSDKEPQLSSTSQECKLYCSKCGNKLSDGAVFCHKCGQQSRSQETKHGKFPDTLYWLPILFGIVGGIIGAMIASQTYKSTWWQLIATGVVSSFVWWGIISAISSF